MVFLYILLALLLLIIILGFIAPNDYKVERSVTINKPRTEIFNYLRSLKNMEKWGPWAKRDANIVQSYSGTDGQVGFVSIWEGNKEVGAGEQEIKVITENERIDTEVRFLKPWKSTSDGFFTVSDQEDGQTRVTWGFTGRNKFPLNIMMLFMNMDKAVGKDFDEGLRSLKKILED